MTERLHKILILDFGSQTTQLIARRIRDLKVYCEIHPCELPPDEIKRIHPDGIVLSGGPMSVYEQNAPACSSEIFSMKIPILGICYGLQLMTKLMGGKVSPASSREYGRTEISVIDTADLLAGISTKEPMVVWMSHGDLVEAIPDGFDVLARSESSMYAVVANRSKDLYGVQFHPEVIHTIQGAKILANFVFNICHCRPNWTMESFVQRSIEAMRQQVGSSQVVCALSGGVDSSVVAALLYRAIGKQLHCIFVDNGLLRKSEAAYVRDIFARHFKMDLTIVDASERFLSRLAEVTDPEVKRKRIGELFIQVFEEQAKKIHRVDFLAQGTLYPDVIESMPTRGPSATIKSHHNVGGLPERMNLKLIEPLRELFKDEVRQLGETLGLPASVVQRHPFPGPGLAVRVIGKITQDRLKVLQEADFILQEELNAHDLVRKTWQTFAILLPVRSVGVMGDERTYEETLVIRSVTSQDGMTADWARLPYDFLARVSNRIINQVKGVNRVLYDVSSKPPATIEWE